MIDELGLLVEGGFVLFADYVKFFKVAEITFFRLVGIWCRFAKNFPCYVIFSILFFEGPNVLA